MKLTTMSLVTCTGVVGLVFACGTLAPGAMAQTHNALNFGHVDQQSPSTNAEPTTVTPESSANQLSTATSQITARMTRSSGCAFVLLRNSENAG